MPTLSEAESKRLLAGFGIPFADITKQGRALIAFLTALNGGEPTGTLAPPLNTGPTVINATYTQPGRPIAVVSNVMLEYKPGPPPKAPKKK